MTLVKSNLCSKCGGALVVNEELQKYECPFCGISFDYEYFQSQEIMEMAESSLRAGDYASAEQRYSFELKKEPHNPKILQGLILCRAKLDSEEKFRSEKALLDVDYPKLENTLEYAEKSAFAEDKEYFASLHKVFTCADELRAIKKTKEELEYKIKTNEKSIDAIRSHGILRTFKRNAEETAEYMSHGGSGLEHYWLPAFWIIYFIFIVVMFLSKAEEMPFEGQMDYYYMVLIVIFVILLLVTIGYAVFYVMDSRKRIKGRMKQNDYFRPELEKALSEEKEKEAELSSLIGEFSKLKIGQDVEKQSPKEDASDRKNADAEISAEEKLTCPSCAGDLFDNKEKAVYECAFCGLTFDYGYIRDELVLDQAERELRCENYHEAEMLFTRAEKTREKNFRVLRGHALCMLEVPGVSSIKLECDPGIKDLQEKIDYLNELENKAEAGDKEYFQKLAEVLKVYMMQEDIHRRTAPHTEIRDTMKRRLNTVRIADPTMPYDVKNKLTHRIEQEEEKLKKITEEKRELKNQVLTIKSELEEVEKQKESVRSE